jgi:hypothetical protein
VNTGLNGLVAKVGGQRQATAIVAAGGAGLVWYIGRRKHAKSQQAQPVNVMAQGYADTAQDPTAVYTGYDQLQQEIDNLRQQPGATNSNPVPVPTSPGSPPPVAPIPTPAFQPYVAPALTNWEPVSTNVQNAQQRIPQLGGPGYRGPQQVIGHV